MPIQHVKTNGFADQTGTITVWNGGTTSSLAATDAVRPSDWNSNHALAFTVAGNTTGGSTVSGTDIVFGASGGVKVSAGAGSIIFSVDPLSSFVPYFPASTSSQTAGAMGTSTASALVFPVIMGSPVVFDCLRVLQSCSFVSSTISGRQTITSAFGIYSRNGDTLSQISSGSFSLALTVSSVSATLSAPNSTNTAGYTYTTVTMSTTAQAHSLIGTAGNRVMDLVFGNTMSLQPGIYWIGIHQRQSTTSANVGLSTGFIGNAMNATSGVGRLGSSTAAFSNNPAYHLGAHGFYTSTGSAGYSGTTLPASMPLTAFNDNLNVMPMVSFLRTGT